MYRVAFNTSLPVVVSAPEVHIGEKRLASGDPLPWRQLGITEHVLFELWRAGMVSFVEEQPAEPEQDEPDSDEPGEHAESEPQSEPATPATPRKRRRG